MSPKPLMRQQMASLILSVLRSFYRFKDTNILDGALTGLLNLLLGLIDGHEVLQYVNHSGALFTLLRGYAELCPHARVHLANLRALPRLLSFLVTSSSGLQGRSLFKNKAGHPQPEGIGDNTIDSDHSFCSPDGNTGSPTSLIPPVTIYVNSQSAASANLVSPVSLGPGPAYPHTPSSGVRLDPPTW
ncbi:unnamed protein product, partial [Protopolystoma xenopodis]